jgi:hypothetical protein
MLLNLSSELSFPCIKEEWALFFYKRWGPSFGNFELKIGSPLNGEKNCYSFANYPAYNIPKVNGDINQLTNEICDKNGLSESTIREMEVWEIIGKK